MMLALLALIACETESVDSAVSIPEPAPDPWLGLEVPLDPFRELLVVPVGTGADGRLAAISRIPALAAWPQAGGGAALLDARYRLAPGPGCLPELYFPAAVDGVDRRGGCAEGEVELDRTHLATGDTVLQVVDDPAARRVAVLLSGGRLALANADLDVGNPWDWLRLQPAGSLTTELGGVPTAFAPADGGWWGLVDDELVRWSAELAVVASYPLSGAGRLLVAGDEQVWVATASTVESASGVLLTVDDARGLVADGAGGVWVASVGDARLRRLDAAGELELELELPGLRGPMAVDPRSGRLYAVVDDGVAVVEGGVQIAHHPIPGVLDVAVNGSSELSVLDDAGFVHVHVDEEALRGPPPLAAWIAAFVENPRAEALQVECEGAPDAMEERAGRASRNRSFLEDVPAVTALAVSPPVALHGRRCKVNAAFAATFTGPRLELGVLFHDPPDCTDQACLDAALAAELEELSPLVPDPVWMAGAAGWEAGGDWVLGLRGTGIDRHAFVGLSALPTVGMDDPRAKDALPWVGEGGSEPLRAETAAEVGEPGGDAGLLLITGSTLAAFNLSGCAGALQAECRFLGLGGGELLDDDDLAVADLLLHRAAANRGEAGLDTWYFHLPAIEEYDYTQGCEVDDARRWSGEDCQARRLQAWLLDVHARLVQAQVVRWGSPGDVR